MSHKQTKSDKNYRATFILDTREVKEEIDKLIEKLKTVLSQLKAQVNNVENLGRKDFSRVTQKNHTGDFFIEIDFTASSEVTAVLKEKLRLDKTVKNIVVFSQP